MKWQAEMVCFYSTPGVEGCLHTLYSHLTMSQDVLSLINSSIPVVRRHTTKLASELVYKARSKPGVALFIGAAVWIVFRSLRRRNAPPGPPRLPLLGNVFQVPLQLQFIPFTEWSKQYGMCQFTCRTTRVPLILNRPNILTRFPGSACHSFKYVQGRSGFIWCVVSWYLGPVLYSASIRRSILKYI